MRHHRLLYLTLIAGSLLGGCQNAEQSPPPPPPELVGGPCKYDETPAIAVVSDSTGEQVRFLIDGRLVPYARQDLPSLYNYDSGMKFSVVEKRITQGTCTPYILEVVGPAAPAPGQPQSRTNVYKQPNPALR